MISLGRQQCSQYATASRLEWLVTNGIGGYASGTVSGALTRHYHGLLVAALEPPLGRTVTLLKLDETVEYDDAIYSLFANAWEDGAVYPRGFKHIESFELEGGVPRWTYAIADAQLEKRIWMEYGENVTYVQYTLMRASRPLLLMAEAVGSYRDHHAGVSREALPDLTVTAVEGGIAVVPGSGRRGYRVLSSAGTIQAHCDWFGGLDRMIEEERGTAGIDDNFNAGRFSVSLREGEQVVFVITAEAQDVEPAFALERTRARERHLMMLARLDDAPPAVQQLVLAADQFVVARGDGHSVIAGYPWFGDWGRDTMIALPGLTLVTGRSEIAARILQTFARYVDQGMLPNRFPDEGAEPEYNTADATLWYFEALRAYFASTGDLDLVRKLYPVLSEILDWHRRGTRYGISVDPADGLLRSGEAGVQLTWMDVKIDDQVVTPRTGKAVEINALWHHALCVTADFTQLLGQDDTALRAEAERVRVSFERFWNGAYLDDVIDTPDGTRDPALRPNQVIAAALYHSPLDTARKRAVVDVCARHLLTSFGLRSLSADHEAYTGDYSGDRVRRDLAYHQGTVWAWLIGPFVEAHLRAYGDRQRAASYLNPLFKGIEAGCLGTLGEVFAGDPPHGEGGAFAQAWSVAEVLRAWRLTEFA
jgi:predicted glycogen debranching enzyme